MITYSDIGIRRNNFTIFILISIFIHLVFVILFLVGGESIRRAVGISSIIRKELGGGATGKEGVYYVKILDMPKPSRPEEPEEKNTPIISQYTTRKKGPMGVQEKSKLSGDSPVTEYIPGVPYGTSTLPSKSSNRQSAGGLGGAGTPNIGGGGASSKGGAATSTNQATSKGGTQMEKSQSSLTYRSNSLQSKTTADSGRMTQGRSANGGSGSNGAMGSGVGAGTGGLQKERIPLIDPRLVDESAKKIVPQMGKGEMKGGVVEISLDARESKYISYFKKIRDRIYLVWRYPPEAASAGIQGTVGIYFVIDRRGEVVEAYITDSSGYAILDKTALNAIYRAAPFGPFPSDWPERELRIRARFIYTIYSRSPF